MTEVTTPVPQPVPAAGSTLAGPAPADLPYGPPAYVYSEPDRLTAFFTRAGRWMPRWAAPAGLAAGCAAASAYVLWNNPTDIGAAALPTCLVRLTTGFDCPGCGGTRALWYLLHGDLAAAAQHHMIAVFAAPFLIYAYVAWTAGTVFGRRLPQLRVSVRTVAVGLGVWAVFTVLRNLPFEPFTWFYV